jgi:hypothetical protein
VDDVDALGELEASLERAVRESADEVVLARGVVIVSWLETSSAPVSRWHHAEFDRPGPEEQCPTEMGRPQGEAVQTRP